MEDRTLMSIFTVTNTGDLNPDGSVVTGSLRAAILAANADTDPAGTTIVFDMQAVDPNHLYYKDDGVPGQVSRSQISATAATDDGAINDTDPDHPQSWWSIRPTSELPSITRPMLIDGYSQPGARPNTRAVGDDAVLRIELDGSLVPTNVGNGGVGLNLPVGESTVRGLAVNRFGGTGIGSSGLIAGNFVGTDISGTLALGNRIGVACDFGRVGIIGRAGGTVADRNVISGNSYFGVGWLSLSCMIAGNYIGTDATGTRALGNGSPSLGVAGGGIGAGSGCTIGTDADGVGDDLERNVISANEYWGAVLMGENSVVAGNFIGTDATGTRPLGNAHGVGIYGGGSNNRIGADGHGAHPDAERNIISGNGEGVSISFFAGANNVVAGNYIGTDVTGTRTLANTFYGVFIGGKSNRIGTDSDGVGDDAERNIISGNNEAAIAIRGGSFNVVAGNYIGTDYTGTRITDPGPDGIHGNGDDLSLGNGRDAAAHAAIYLREASLGNRIGVDGHAANPAAGRNVISGNVTGISFSSPDPVGNVVAGNYIGTDKTGTRGLPNLVGIQVYSAGNRIGTDGDGVGDAFEGNLISANTYYGVGFNGFYAPAMSNRVAGNLIGTDMTGSAALDQPQGAGIVMSSGASSNQIGGDGPLANTIAFNQMGVVVLSGAGNAIRGNSIHSNSGLGIDLNGDGVTLNGSHAGQPGPNDWQNFPVLSALRGGRTTRVTGTLESTPNTNFLVDLYAGAVADPSGYGEGQRHLGWVEVTTDANGHADFDISLAATTGLGEWITATATGPAGTSEFSRAEVMTTVVQPVQIDVLQQSVNVGEQGVITVAVLTTADFNAAWVNVATIRFAGAAAVQGAFEDIDHDGDLDLVLHFRVQDTALRSIYERLLGDDLDQDGVLDSTRQLARVSLTGETVDGVFVEGSELVDLFLSGKKLRQLLASLFG